MTRDEHNAETMRLALRCEQAYSNWNESTATAEARRHTVLTQARAALAAHLAAPPECRMLNGDEVDALFKGGSTVWEAVVSGQRKFAEVNRLTIKEATK